MDQPTPVGLVDPAMEHADALYYRGVLHELIELGMALARGVQAQAAAGDVPAAEAAVAFERVARCVRRSVLLARKVAEPVPPARLLARRQIIRAVEDGIQRRHDGEAAERLRGELLERLDAPELEEEIGHRPVAEIVAEICRDLGLEAAAGVHAWQRRTPADVAALCALARRPEPEPAGRGSFPPGCRAPPERAA